MCIIFCDIQMFSNNQLIHVYDTEKNQIVFVQKADIENLSDSICAIANRYSITEVRLGGQTAYALPVAEEIRTAYALSYNNNIINVEVI